MSAIKFEPPGPGTWLRNDDHFPRPVSRYFQSFYPVAFDRGFNEGTRRYGLPVDLKPGLVHGFWYMSPRAVSSPDPEGVSTRDELERRAENAARAFETRYWRTDLVRWDEEWRPTLEATNRSLIDVDPAALGDIELSEHLEACLEAARDAAYYHHRLTLADLIPRGDFVAFAVEHTDRRAGDIVRVLTGDSPGSVDVVTDLRALSLAIQSSPNARERLTSVADPADLIEEFRTRDDAIGEAMRNWLEVAGYRLVTGYDVAEIYGLEQPELLDSILRAAVTGAGSEGERADEGAKIEDLQAAVPAPHRSEFNERFEEARRMNRLRDERSLMDNWTLGITRRGLLAAGRRLSERGKLRAPGHVVDLTHDELVSALRGGPSPGAAEVAVHVRHRVSTDPAAAPSVLGPESSGPPQSDRFPAPVARSMKAWATLMESGGSVTDREDSGAGVVQGLAASPGRAEGPARVVTGPSDFGIIEAGDILVAEATSSSFNVVLPLLGAIVTDHGGVLSHPAIVAREFGVPGVVGCEDATELIQDGDHIVVDGDEGTVQVTE